MLGGAAARNLCEYAGVTSLAASASGLVNGCGSLGAILQVLGRRLYVVDIWTRGVSRGPRARRAQGSLTGGLVGAAGWSGLFFTLAGAMLATSVAVHPAIAVEAEAKRKAKRQADIRQAEALVAVDALAHTVSEPVST